MRGLEVTDHMGDRVPHVRERLVPVGRHLGERPIHDRHQIRTDVGIELRDSSGRAVQDRLHDAVLGVTRKGLAVREQLVNHRADREDVAAVIDGRPFDLLRRHVAGRPQEHARSS